MVFFVCLFLMGLGFELRALPEQSRCSTAWATPSSLFCFGYFGDRLFWTIWAGLNRDPPYLSLPSS
jgi:hypothetical protein